MKRSERKRLVEQYTRELAIVAEETCKRIGHILVKNRDNIVDDPALRGVMGSVTINDEYLCEVCDTIFYFPCGTVPQNPYFPPDDTVACS